SVGGTVCGLLLSRLSFGGDSVLARTVGAGALRARVLVREAGAPGAVRAALGVGAGISARPGPGAGAGHGSRRSVRACTRVRPASSRSLEESSDEAASPVAVPPGEGAAAGAAPSAAVPSAAAPPPATAPEAAAAAARPDAPLSAPAPAEPPPPSAPAVDLFGLALSVREACSPWDR